MFTAEFPWERPGGANSTILGPFGCFWVQFWSFVDPLGTILGRFWGYLAQFEPILNHFGIISGPFLGYLEQF